MQKSSYRAASHLMMKSERENGTHGQGVLLGNQMRRDEHFAAVTNDPQVKSSLITKSFS